MLIVVGCGMLVVGLCIGVLVGYRLTYVKRRWPAEMAAYRAIHDYAVLEGYDVSEWTPADYEVALNHAYTTVTRYRLMAKLAKDTADSVTRAFAPFMASIRDVIESLSKLNFHE